MVNINPQNVIYLLEEAYGPIEKTENITIEETQLFNSLQSVIDSAISGGNLRIEEQSDLYLSDPFHPELPTKADIIRSYELLMKEKDLTYFPEPQTRSQNRNISLQRKMEIVAFWEPEGKPKRRFSTVKNRFKYEVRYPIDLPRFKRDVQEGGTRVEKLIYVYSSAFDSFLEAKRQFSAVTDIDLRRWALKSARTVRLHGFKASPSWCLNFKKDYNIVSRKITKYITKSSIQSQPEILQASKTFTENTGKYIQTIGLGRAFNGDQIGFARELHCGRTLALCGDTDVHSLAQSLSNMSHSYTAMPTLSALGEFLPKMLLVLQEPTGQFGPEVRKKMIVPDNLIVLASKSGKMSRGDVKIYFRECFAPYCGPKATLLLDQWNGFKNRDFLEDVQGEFNTEIEILDLPKKSTMYTQPLDKHVFRMLKDYIRKLSDKIILLDIDFVLGQRQNIIYIQSFAFRQFTSPRHKTMLLKAWSKAGYTPEITLRHITPAQWSFGSDGDFCDHVGCRDIKLIRCTWCKLYLCLQHSVNELHNCNNYKP
ncbi:hypothetical protein B566_EDAN006463 [Ephemera danica]|nr:hypothetical protein B566_EDAN006463 [Ephemera danica]